MLSRTIGVFTLGLSLICLVLSIASLSGNWWRGNFGADTFLGLGTASVDVSLWRITTDGSVLGFGLPQNEFSIDSEHMCGTEQLLEKMGEICSKIKVVRAFMILSLVVVCLSTLLSAWIVLADFLEIRKQTLARWSGMIVATLAFLSTACVGVAFGVAYSMPGREEAQQLGVVGAGAMCAIAQLLCCIILIIVALSYWRFALRTAAASAETKDLSTNPPVAESA